MAKDRISIFIPALNFDILRQEDTWIIKPYRGPWRKHSADEMTLKNPRRISKYKFGCMSTTAGLIDVEFMRTSENYGDLLFSCSVSEVYFGYNTIPKSSVDVRDFAYRVLFDLDAVLDTNHLPHHSTWCVSRDESNVDILDTQENNDMRQEIISKLCMPYRKIDNDLKSKGSIYQRGSAGKRSKSQFIAYDKVKEQEERKELDLRQLLGLNPRQGCLRLEVKLAGGPLKNTITKVFGEMMDGTSYSPLALVMDGYFQFSILWKAITDLHLDKIITTRTKLLKIIRTSQKLTQHEKKQAQLVVNHLNGHRYSAKIHRQTMRKYCNLILSLGYHPLYAVAEIQPITEHMLRNALGSDLKFISFLHI